MPDLNIETLTLRIEGAGVEAYRLQPITLRALDLLAERLDAHKAVLGGRQVDAVSAAPVSVDAAQSDEEVAQAVADAWLDAILGRMGT